MTSPLLLDHYAVPLDDGHFVPARVLNVVELVRGYDPSLDVEWIPPEHRVEAGDPEYRITETRAGKTYTVFCVREAEFDERVLARLVRADNTRTPLSTIEAREEAARVLRAKEAREQRMLGHDMFAAAFRSPKARWTFRSLRTGEIIRAE